MGDSANGINDLFDSANALVTGLVSCGNRRGNLWPVYGVSTPGIYIGNSGKYSRCNAVSTHVWHPLSIHRWRTRCLNLGSHRGGLTLDGSRETGVHLSVGHAYQHQESCAYHRIVHGVSRGAASAAAQSTSIFLSHTACCTCAR